MANQPLPAPPIDASTTNRGLVNTTTQAFSGTKTFNTVVANTEYVYPDGTARITASSLGLGYDGSTIALWHMDDSGSTSADATGTYTLTAFANNPASVPGQVNTARATVQTTSCFISSNLSSGTKDQLNSGTWSLCFWLKPGVMSATAGITLVQANGLNLGSADSDTVTIRLEYDVTNRRINIFTYTTHSSATTTAIGSVGAIPVGAWSHFAVTRTDNGGSQGGNATFTFYINGVSVTSFTAATPSAASTGTYTIGIGGYKDISNSYPNFTGSFDDVGLYSITLTAAQIAAIYAAGTAPNSISIAPAGSVPNNSGGTIVGSVLTLQPASGSNPGILTTGSQTIAGSKTFSSTITGDISGNAGSTTNFSGSLTGDVTGGQSSTVLSNIPATVTATGTSGTVVTSSAANTGTNTALTIDTSATLGGSTSILRLNTGGTNKWKFSATTITFPDGSTQTTAGGGGSGTLSGDVTGPESATVVAFVDGSAATAVHTAELLANAATNANTASTIVKRDGSGNFTAGTITAALTGNVTGNASGTAASFTGSLVGDVTGTQGATVLSNVPGTVTATNTSGTTVTSSVANSGTNTALTLNTSNALSGSTSILKLRSNSVTKWAFSPSTLTFPDGSTQTTASSGGGSSGSYTYTATATAGGTTTLTNASNTMQEFTGTNSQTIVLPDATTLTVGIFFKIVNSSTGALTLQNGSAATILIIPPGYNVMATVTSIGSTAGTWNAVLPPFQPPPSTKWDAESGTSPSVGTFTQLTESGISGGSFSVDTASGNAFKVTQTGGDTSWGHVIGVTTNTPTNSDYRVRASIRIGSPFNTTYNRFVVGARISVTSNILSGYLFGFLATSAGGDNSIYLIKDSNGTQSALRGPINIGTILTGLVAGDRIDLAIDVKGGQITCIINGVRLWYVYDTAFTGGTGLVGALPAQSGQAQSILLCDYFDVIPHYPSVE